MAAAAPSNDPQTIVLIHGMWMTGLSWEHWAERYRGLGHEVLAPSWPGLDKEPEELRRDPSPLHGLSIPDMVDSYDSLIRGLDRPPIIIGHSFGGLITQLLLDRGLGSAGVARPQDTVLAEYRAAGLDYGPPGAPLETLDELGQVKSRNALPTWDATLLALLAQAGQEES